MQNWEPGGGSTRLFRAMILPETGTNRPKKSNVPFPVVQTRPSNVRLNDRHAMFC
jgi:hypothetical protein